MPLLLGCIADDLTGATDVASALVKQGLRTVQMIGASHGDPPPADIDAVVIALKTRTSPVASAVEQSLTALEFLHKAGCRRFYFKYCSTFDSTPAGNIGPVAEALMDRLDVGFTLVCPAFPENGRTIYKGYLFVGDVLLSESGMRNHPLTPMTDANLMRVLAPQVKRKVGLIDFATVAQGPQAVRRQMQALANNSVGFGVADALANQDLETLGDACLDLALATGGSGLAWGLAGAMRRHGLLAAVAAADELPEAQGLRAVVSGSCSSATLGQVALMRERHPSFPIDLDALEGGHAAESALEWAAARIGKEPVLIYSTAAPSDVKAVQSRFGTKASTLVETTLARIARGLVNDLGVGQLIVAGGETSGAVVEALAIERLRIGPEIDPGVPWTMAESGSGPPLALALKSGNFGTEDFFLKAWGALT